MENSSDTSSNQKFIALYLVFFVCAAVLLFMILSSDSKSAGIISGILLLALIGGFGVILFKLQIKTSVKIKEILDSYINKECFSNEACALPTQGTQEIKPHERLKGVFMATDNLMIEVNNHSETLKSSIQALNQTCKNVTHHLEKVTTNVTSVTNATDEVNEKSKNVSNSMEEASENINVVAAGAEELSSTIDEIAQNTNKAENISKKAVGLAKESSSQISFLGEKANEIGNVTEVITEISEQTNLLALNATIEAARAGDAGKGFNVVAEEIKALSNQTSQATIDIKTKINEIQSEITNTVSVIQEIEGVISNMNDIVSSIAAAVQEQSIATQNIAENIGQASAGINDVGVNVSGSTNDIHTIKDSIHSVSDDILSLFQESLKLNVFSDEMEEISRDLKNNVEEYQCFQPAFDIAKVKTAHLLWRIELEAAIKGYQKISAKDISSHEHCEFGKWYISAKSKWSNNSDFQNLGDKHKDVHDIIKRIAGLIEQNKLEQAKSLLPEFEKTRQKMFNYLNILYRS